MDNLTPQFPEFKELEITDKQAVNFFVNLHPPYSDYNFISLWSWNTRNGIQWSVLNDNLVIKFTDYVSAKPFYSYLGANEVNDTIQTLLTHSAESKIDPVLSLVPEASMKGVDSERFHVSEDRDNFDYIYNLQDLSQLKGNKYSDKRTMINRLLRNFPNPEIRFIDVNTPEGKSEIMNLNLLWRKNKTQVFSDSDFENEHTAIERFLLHNHDQTICMGAYIDGILVGYTIFTILDNRHAICHFRKTLINYEGVNEFLMRECAIMLVKQGVLFMNEEQDLGLPGLRFTKSSFKPTTFLKKYIVKNH